VPGVAYCSRQRHASREQGGPQKCCAETSVDGVLQWPVIAQAEPVTMVLQAGIFSGRHSIGRLPTRRVTGPLPTGREIVRKAAALSEHIYVQP
jgi:hypothetical protein